MLSYRITDYNRATLPNHFLASLEVGVETPDDWRARSGLSIGQPGWGLIYHLVLCSLDPERHNNIIETGTNFGCSCIVLAQALKDSGRPGRVHSIELHERNHETARDYVRRASVDDVVELHLGDSIETLERLLPELGSVRVAFLDGNHERDHVLREFELVLPHLCDQGVVVLDNTYEFFEDGQSATVHAALKEILVRHGGHLVNLPFVSWSTPGLAIWQRQPFVVMEPPPRVASAATTGAGTRARAGPQAVLARVQQLRNANRAHEALAVLADAARAPDADESVIEALIELRAKLYALEFERCRAEWPARRPGIGGHGPRLGLGAVELELDPRDGGACYNIAAHSIGALEPYERALFCETVSAMPGAQIVDGGASYGIYTVTALLRLPAPRPGQIIAVEPDPVVAACLRRNVLAHDRDDAVRVREAVLADVDRDEVELALNPGASVDNRLAGAPSNERGWRRIAVPAVTLDTLLTERRAPSEPASELVLKLDIQGSEKLALEGGRRVLAGYESVVAFLELDPAMLAEQGATVEELVDLLRELGLASFHGIDELRRRLTAFDGPDDLLHAARECQSRPAADPRRYLNVVTGRGDGMAGLVQRLRAV